MTVSANTNKDVRSNILSFKNEMRKNPQVLSISTSQGVPGSGINFQPVFR